MKHLRKFNETVNFGEPIFTKLDNEYIKNCFIEFVDNGTAIEKIQKIYKVDIIQFEERSNDKITINLANR